MQQAKPLFEMYIYISANSLCSRLVPRLLVSGQRKKSLGTHCLHMLSFPRISRNLEISVKSALLY